MMLKRRIAAAVIVKDGIAVQSIAFSRYLPVGRPEVAVEFLSQWGVDEIVLLDISATREGRVVSPELVKRVAARCLVPLAVGGGIGSVEDIDGLLQAGADKVCVNRALSRTPEFVTAAAQKFGNQCIVASIDVRAGKVHDHLSSSAVNLGPLAFARRAEALGAGEILLNAVDRDGQRNGFDLDLNAEVSAGLTIPVIALGGAGRPTDFQEVFQRTQVRAACAANFFHYSEHSVIRLKAELVNNDLAVRLETSATYREASCDGEGRLLKKADQELERLLYIRIEKETI
jgi:imidazole glycerol-phosphate synthase subunit HisF